MSKLGIGQTTLPWWLSIVIGLVSIAAGLVSVLTLGQLYANWDYTFCFWHSEKRMQAKLKRIEFERRN